MKQAFTMVELIFVIVIIGILSAVAIPKFEGIASSAYEVKAKATLASVRSALSTERQKLILQGKFGAISKLRNGTTGVFTSFVYLDKDGTEQTGSKVLEYDIKSCSNIGCWVTSNSVDYTYKGSSGDCTYKLQSNRFDDTTTGGCSDLGN